MTQVTPMKCPMCGGQMNRHAEKVIASSDPIDARDVDADLGGILHEAHACPRCGAIALRRGAGTSSAATS